MNNQYCLIDGGLKADHKKRQSTVALPFLIPFKLLVAFKAIELYAKSVGPYPDDFAVGSDGDFKVREKKLWEII